jgi:hypothetical protein
LESGWKNGWAMIRQWLNSGKTMVRRWLDNGWTMVGKWSENGWTMDSLDKLVISKEKGN